MKKSFLFILSLFVGQTTAVYAQSPQINIYSFRKYELIKPVLTQFEAESGIKVNLVNGKSKRLLARLKQDGEASQADVILSSDLAQLHNHKDLLQPIERRATWQNIANELYDENGYWVSISMRTRALFSLTEKASLAIPKTFAKLDQTEYQSSLCIRDWQHNYNATLTAALLTTNNRKDSDWLKLGNKLLAKRPSGGDRDQLRALAKGHCKLAFANHYYWHMMKRADNKRDQMLAKKIKHSFLTN
ncbi:extracellular solute-binding protein [Pseudoalteromonas phenolica O-BC30]|nr:extracellular solute-binding protein [Pseudoalteromonas phenolica O-BC30]